MRIGLLDINKKGVKTGVPMIDFYFCIRVYNSAEFYSQNKIIICKSNIQVVKPPI